MGRTVFAVIVSLIVWFAIAFCVGYFMRTSWSAYAAVADAMTFTLPMMLARLALGVLATVFAAWLAGRIATHRKAAPIALGFVLLAIFIPQHTFLWDKFPLWYHLFFLASLVPLAILGSRIRRASPSLPQHSAA